MRLIKDNFLKLLKSRLISGSFVMVVGSLAAGLGNYLYHLLMGRMLGPVDYGILASLISLLYILSIPVGVLNLVIVKFVSTIKGQKELGAVSLFYTKIREKFLLYSGVALLFFFALTPILASFLHLDSALPLFFVGVFAFIAIFCMINRATLQGLLRFISFSISTILEVILKVLFAVFLVAWGYKINGALAALIIGGLAGYFFAQFSLRDLFQIKGKKITVGGHEVLKFAAPVFFSTFSFTLLYTADIVLVRHFLPAREAGYYAALATLGKIIYFVSAPITLVMFPMVSELHANGKRHRHLLFASLGLVILFCLGITAIYFLFPELMVGLLFGKAYLPASAYLGLFGIFLSLYSLSFLLVNYCLSVNKVKVVIFPLVAAIFQVIFISLFHQNFGQVIKISLLVTALLLFPLLLYSLKNEKP